MIGPDPTRAARPQDGAEIAALLREAFGRNDEADLVVRLRADGDAWLELVKEWNGGIAAYAMLSRMRSPQGWACLAPLAVLPRFQRGAAAPDQTQKFAYAFGTRLAHEIATGAAWAEGGHDATDVPDTVVVLGDPAFYERAGFSRRRARALVSPYPIAHTLIARAGDDAPAVSLVYPHAFDALS